MRSDLGIGPQSRPYTNFQHIQLRGLPATKRQQDLLDIAFATRAARYPDKNERQLRANFWANASQSVQRKPWGDHPMVLTTSSELYSFEADVVLSGASHLRLLGAPSNISHDISESRLRKLAGEAYSVPLMSIIFTAVYLCPHQPWWNQG